MHRKPPLDPKKRPFPWIPGLAILLCTGVILLITSATAQAQTSTPPAPTPSGSLPGMGEQSWVILPELPADATQADYGHQIYVLVCQACHGDDGRGLTHAWISQWNPRDQNCWQSKCHATNHPPDGFSLPRYVPPIMGSETLAQFRTTLDLYNYIRATMPWQDPGILTDDDYWKLTAFLLRSNQLGDLSKTLDADTAAQMVLNPQAANPTLPAEVSATASAQAEARPAGAVIYYAFGGFLLLVVVGLVVRILFRPRP